MKLKRLFSGLLAALVTITCSNVQAYAATGDGGGTALPPSNTQNAKPVEGSDVADYPGLDKVGFVGMTKSAEWVGGDSSLGQATVRFELYGTGVPTGTDTVIVFDRSASMTEPILPKQTVTISVVCKSTEYDRKGSGSNRYWECENDDCKFKHKTNPNGKECGNKYEDKVTLTRFMVAQQSAKKLVEKLFADNAVSGATSQNRVALVTFSGDAKKINGGYFYSAKPEEKAALLQAIDDIEYPKDGTEYSDALQAATDVLTARTDDKVTPSNVVLLTDGVPDGVDKDAGCTRKTSNTASKDFRCLDCPVHNGRTQVDAMKTHEKVNLVNLTTVGFAMDNYEGDVLTKANTLLAYIATPKEGTTEKQYYKANSAKDLDAAFDQFAATVQKAGTNAVITDWINTELFTLDTSRHITMGPKGNLQVLNAKDVVKENGRIEVIIGDIGQPIFLEIPVVVKAGLNDGDEKTYIYPTNASQNPAKVEYDNFDGKDCTQKVESPVLSRPLSAIAVNAYLVNKDGEAITFDGATIDDASFEKARVQLGKVVHGEKDKGTYEIPLGEYIVLNGKNYMLVPKARLAYKPVTFKDGKYTTNVTVEKLDNVYTIWLGYREVNTGAMNVFAHYGETKYAADMLQGYNPYTVEVDTKLTAELAGTIQIEWEKTEIHTKNKEIFQDYSVEESYILQKVKDGESLSPDNYIKHMLNDGTALMVLSTADPNMELHLVYPAITGTLRLQKNYDAKPSASATFMMNNAQLGGLKKESDTSTSEYYDIPVTMDAKEKSYSFVETAPMSHTGVSPFTVTAKINNGRNGIDFTLASNVEGVSLEGSTVTVGNKIINYTVTASVDKPEAGSITATTQNVQHGGNSTELVLTVNPGYQIDSVKDNGTTDITMTPSTTNPGTYTYTVAGVKENHAVVATLTKKPVKVKVEYYAGGTTGEPLTTTTFENQVWGTDFAKSSVKLNATAAGVTELDTTVYNTDGSIVSPDPTKDSWEISKDGLTIKVVFDKKDEAKVTVKHVYEAGKDEPTENYTTGAPFYVGNSLTFGVDSIKTEKDGYVLDTATPNGSIAKLAATNEIILTYKHTVAPVTINYYVGSMGEGNLAGTVDGGKVVWGQTYNKDLVERNGTTLKAANKLDEKFTNAYNPDGQFVTTNFVVTANGLTIDVVFAKKGEAKVTVKHVYETNSTATNAYPTTETLYVGDSLTFIGKDLAKVKEGYAYVSASPDGSIASLAKDNTITLTYKHTEAPVTINYYLDKVEGTPAISAPVAGTFTWGDSYTGTVEADGTKVDGLNLTNAYDPTGKVVTENRVIPVGGLVIDVVFTKKGEASVTVVHNYAGVETATNAYPTTGPLYVGNSLTFTGSNLAVAKTGYAYVSASPDGGIASLAKDNTITLTYKRTEATVTINYYLDEVKGTPAKSAPVAGTFTWGDSYTGAVEADGTKVEGLTLTNAYNPTGKIVTKNFKIPVGGLVIDVVFEKKAVAEITVQHIYGTDLTTDPVAYSTTETFYQGNAFTFNVNSLIDAAKVPGYEYASINHNGTIDPLAATNKIVLTYQRTKAPVTINYHLDDIKTAPAATMPGGQLTWGEVYDSSLVKLDAADVTGLPTLTEIYLTKGEINPDQSFEVTQNGLVIDVVFKKKPAVKVFLQHIYGTETPAEPVDYIRENAPFYEGLPFTFKGEDMKVEKDFYEYASSDPNGYIASLADNNLIKLNYNPIKIPVTINYYLDAVDGTPIKSLPGVSQAWDTVYDSKAVITDATNEALAGLNLSNAYRTTGTIQTTDFTVPKDMTGLIIDVVFEKKAVANITVQHVYGTDLTTDPVAYSTTETFYQGNEFTFEVGTLIDAAKVPGYEYASINHNGKIDSLAAKNEIVLTYQRTKAPVTINYHLDDIKATPVATMEGGMFTWGETYTNTVEVEASQVPGLTLTPAYLTTGEIKTTDFTVTRDGLTIDVVFSKRQEAKVTVKHIYGDEAPVEKPFSADTLYTGDSIIVNLADLKDEAEGYEFVEISPADGTEMTLATDNTITLTYQRKAYKVLVEYYTDSVDASTKLGDVDLGTFTWDTDMRPEIILNGADINAAYEDIKVPAKYLSDGIIVSPAVDADGKLLLGKADMTVQVVLQSVPASITIKHIYDNVEGTPTTVEGSFFSGDSFTFGDSLAVYDAKDYYIAPGTAFGDKTLVGGENIFSIYYTSLNKFNVTTQLVGSGTVTPERAGPINQGENSDTFTFTPATGWMLVSLEDTAADGTTTAVAITEDEANNGKSYAVTGIAANHTLKAVFERVYRVEFYLDGDPNPIVNTTLHKRGSSYGEVTIEEIKAVESGLPAGSFYDWTVEPDWTINLLDTQDAVIRVTFTPNETIVDGAMVVTDRYYLNETTLESTGSKRGIKPPQEAGSFDLGDFLRTNGYTFWKVNVVGTLRPLDEMLPKAMEMNPVLNAPVVDNSKLDEEFLKSLETMTDEEKTALAADLLAKAEGLKQEIELMITQTAGSHVTDTDTVLSWLAEYKALRATDLTAQREALAKVEAEIAALEAQLQGENTPVTLPETPETTEPIAPDATEPAAPEATEPAAPEATEPAAPEATEPVAPATSEPTAPEAAEPVVPEATEPVAPATTGLVVNTGFAAPAITRMVATVATPESEAPVSSEATPPVSSEATPPVSSEATPPVSSEATPPVSSEATPPVSSEATPPVSSEATPPASSEATPPASSEATPPVSSEATPPASSEATPPATPEATTPAVPEVVPQPVPETTAEKLEKLQQQRGDLLLVLDERDIRLAELKELVLDIAKQQNDLEKLAHKLNALGADGDQYLQIEVVEEEAILETELVEKPATVTFDTLSFDFDPDYDYEVVLDYNRTVTTPTPTPPGDDDDDDDYDGGGGGGGGTTNIPDANIPLGGTILLDENIPLGALPTTGGKSKALTLGTLAILLGMFIKRRKTEARASSAEQK